MFPVVVGLLIGGYWLFYDGYSRVRNSKYGGIGTISGSSLAQKAGSAVPPEFRAAFDFLAPPTSINPISKGGEINRYYHGLLDLWHSITGG